MSSKRKSGNKAQKKWGFSTIQSIDILNPEEQKLKNFRKSSTYGEMAKRIKELASANSELNAENTLLQTKISKLEEDYSQLNYKYLEIRERDLDFLTEKEEANDKVIDLRGQISELEEKLNDLQEQNRGLKEEIEEIQHEHCHHESKHKELCRKATRAFDQLLIKDLKIDELESERDRLRNSIKELYEEFF